MIKEFYRVLSIDAWREPEGWSWNNWFNAGELPIDLIDKNPRTILAWMRREGFLKDTSKGKIFIEDDQYNLVIKAKSNGQPLFAIEYGGEKLEREFPDCVTFVKFKGEILALFPDLIESRDGTKIQSYARVGQHSPACKSLLRCKKASLEEYQALKTELESIGYKLEITNKG